MGPNTIRKYQSLLSRSGLLDGRPEELPPPEVVRSALTAAIPSTVAVPMRASSLEPRRQAIEGLLTKGLGARAVYDRLRTTTLDGGGFTASYSAVKRFCGRIRRSASTGAEEVAIPVESAPGECAQVDFGYAGRLYDPESGRLRRAWVWVMLLCHSRRMVVRLVFDQRVETWLALHVQAFAELGGVVAVVRPDNLRRAVLRATFGAGGECELNRSYRELARHYGFVVDPAPPGDPKKRGKVEAAVKYLRNNPLKGRDGEPIDLVQADLLRWNEEVASMRIHGTTRQRPREVFERVERDALRPLPASPCELAVWKKARVHPDCHIAFRDRLYSVPWPHVGAEVWLRATASEVEAFHDDRLVAVHSRRGPRRSTIEAHLPPDRRDYRHRGRSFWLDRAARIGPESHALVREVFDREDGLSHLRSAQAIVKHLEAHPRDRAEAASQQARLLGERSYGAIKAILNRGLDLGQYRHSSRTHELTGIPSESDVEAHPVARPATATSVVASTAPGLAEVIGVSLR